MGVVILVVFSSGKVANRLWWYLESSAEDTFDPAITYDAAVLLGGVQDRGFVAPGEQPSYGENVDRLLMTYDLLRRGQAKVAIISGAVPDKVKHADFEALVLGRQLTAWGIAPERIVIEGTALNTRATAVESAKIARSRGYERVLVVTSAFHMQRTLGCFRATGLKVDTLSVDRRASNPADSEESFLPRARHLEGSSAALRELVGRLVYRMNGYSQ